MYVGLYATVEEQIRYGDKDQSLEALSSFLEETGEELSLLDADVRTLERRNEVLEEQVYFARSLIEKLESSLRLAVRLRDFRKDFDAAISDSSFER